MEKPGLSSQGFWEMLPAAEQLEQKPDWPAMKNPH